MGKEAVEYKVRKDKSRGEVMLRNMLAEEVFGAFFSNKDMRERFSAEEKLNLGLVMAKAWKERGCLGGDYDEVGAPSITEDSTVDVFTRETKEVKVGDVLRFGRWKNHELWVWVEAGIETITQPAYFWGGQVLLPLPNCPHQIQRIPSHPFRDGHHIIPHHKYRIEELAPY